MLTGARDRASAAFRPPKPAPTITTRWVVLPFIAPLYKIQRDGNRLGKFRPGRSSGVGTVVGPVRGRFDFRGAAGFACVYTLIGTPTGRRRSRLAHSRRTVDSLDPRDPPHRSVFLNHGWPALVCLGVA